MGIEIKEGITPKQIDQLVDYSKTDLLVQQFTSDPKRFANKDEFERWVQDRNVYTFPDSEGNLLGIVWFGEKELPERDFILEFNYQEYGITFAIRTYKEARGMGLAQEFMGKAMEMFKSSEAFQKAANQGVWLETSIDNEPAVRAYKRFGFRQVSSADPEGKIIMILSEEI